MANRPHPIQKILELAASKAGLNKVGTANKESQLSLAIGRERQEDRNFEKGGRSFYFFDFDDNVAYLTTSIYLFHKKNGQEISISSGRFAEVSESVGESGEYKDYYVDFDDNTGSFRNFRDLKFNFVDRLWGREQRFIRDVGQALDQEDFNWKGPSWDCFYHAVFNQRPLSVITARGHHPETIKKGIEAMVGRGFLPSEPNYLSVFPVSHLSTRQQLGDFASKESVAELKKRAIRSSVEEAFKSYGYNPHHRFGMSDDDPNNVRLITQSMQSLKREYTENAFFVFDSSGGRLIKREVFTDHVESRDVASGRQLSLFDEFDG